MTSAEHHIVYDLDDDDSEDDPQQHPYDQTPSSYLATGDVTIAVSGVRHGDPSAPSSGVILALPYLKRKRVENAAIAAEEEKKPPATSRPPLQLFQRLWTDEDEIELLRGFLEYSSQHHHDTAAFYEQIRSKLQLDFTKNQLVDKLRRLKKKYRTVSSKIGSGKEFVFKSPHDCSTFEISRKIWSVESRFESKELNPNPNPSTSPSPSPSSFCHNNNSVDTSTPQKRIRGVKIEEKPKPSPQSQQIATPADTPISNTLIHNASISQRFGHFAALNPMPIRSLNFGGGDVMDERWRQQQILELEVYSKRLELVQEQIKLALEELRSRTD